MTSWKGVGLTLGMLGDFGRVLFCSGQNWFLFSVLDNKFVVVGGQSLWLAIFA
jgi:hypothetical protein